MLPPNRIWYGCPGASEDDLQRLQSVADVKLPREYLTFLACTNGGEGPLSVQPYNLCLDSAESAASLKANKTYAEFFPGFFVIGTNGGGEYIALDLRRGEPWPVVAIDMTNIDLSESVMLIAKDFASFLSLVGIEAEDA